MQTSCAEEACDHQCQITERLIHCENLRATLLYAAWFLTVPTTELPDHRIAFQQFLKKKGSCTRPEGWRM